MATIEDTPPPGLPDDVDLPALLATAFARLDARDLDEAERCFRLVLDHDLLEPRAWVGLGNCWVLQDRPLPAIEAFRQALGLAPGYDEARANLGMALNLTGQTEDAVALLGELIEDRPDSFEAAVNYAVAAKRLGLWAEALASFERAAAMRPQELRLIYEISLLRLGLGDFAAGWRDYEMRWIGNHVTPPLLPGVPEWQGDDPAGKTILILPEQGMGDAIQFVRYAKVLKAQGAKVLMACVTPLLRLLGGQDYLDHVTDTGRDLPPFDSQIMLMSLPLRFGTEARSIPADIPYITPDPAIVAHWRGRLPERPGLKIGLVWAGGAHSDNATAADVDRRRSLNLKALAPLFDVPHTRFISLQFGPPAADIAAHPGLAIEDYMADVADFADTAGLVACLDLVIAVDTSVAHLAGALGKPVWVLSRVDGCWRWLNEGSTSAWYPTLRLFRQTDRHDWADVVNAIRQDLVRKTKPLKRL